jgi:hypothetical protein
MPRIAIIKPACSTLLILLSISAVPQEAARADAASGQLLFNNACRTCHTMKEGDNRLPAKIPALRFATPYPRVSNDTPSENAFCCVAPGVRFSDFAILATGVFWRASVFNSRTSSLVHSRRFAFFAIFTGSMFWGRLRNTALSGATMHFITGSKNMKHCAPARVTAGRDDVCL